MSVSSGVSGRLQLAQWLTHSENPLTARVMVNRIWQHHFGRGIVATPSNFGTRGEPPTDPELLDFLARYFIEHGWSIKSMHRLILTSKTWRTASVQSPRSKVQSRETKASDFGPETSDFGLAARRRLDAEAIRDAMLSVAGTLDLARPGQHPFPDIKTWGWTQHTPFKDVYPSQHRSVYLMTQRIQRHPLLALFDGPDTNTTTEQRTSSTVPLQALFWMNSPLVQEQSAAFARRLVASSADSAERLRLAFRLAYSREPTSEESERYVRFVDAFRSELAKSGVEANQAELEAWASVAKTILSSNEFVYVD